MDSDFKLIDPAFNPVILSKPSYLLRVPVSLWLEMLSYTPNSIRSGFSTHSLIRTKNWTASRPSISRWS